MNFTYYLDGTGWATCILEINGQRLVTLAAKVVNSNFFLFHRYDFSRLTFKTIIKSINL